MNVLQEHSYVKREPQLEETFFRMEPLNIKMECDSDCDVQDVPENVQINEIHRELGNVKCEVREEDQSSNSSNEVNFMNNPPSTRDERTTENFGSSNFQKTLLLQRCLSLLDSSSSDDEELMLLWWLCRKKKENLRKRSRKRC